MARIPTTRDRMKALGVSVQELDRALEGPLRVASKVSRIDVYVVKTGKILVRTEVPFGMDRAVDLAKELAQVVAEMWSVKPGTAYRLVSEPESPASGSEER